MSLKPGLMFKHAQCLGVQNHRILVVGGTSAVSGSGLPPNAGVLLTFAATIEEALSFLLPPVWEVWEGTGERRNEWMSEQVSSSGRVSISGCVGNIERA